jgi:hypothetical protein
MQGLICQGLQYFVAIAEKRLLRGTLVEALPAVVLFSMSALDESKHVPLGRPRGRSD